MFSNILNSPIYDYQEKDVSYYYNMLTHDLDDINEKYIHSSQEIIVAIGGFIISIIALLRINVLMSIIFIAMTLVVMVLPSFLSSLQTNSRTNFSKNYEKYMNHLENIWIWLWPMLVLFHLKKN